MAGALFSRYGGEKGAKGWMNCDFHRPAVLSRRLPGRRRHGAKVKVGVLPSGRHNVPKTPAAVNRQAERAQQFAAKIDDVRRLPLVGWHDLERQRIFHCIGADRLCDTADFVKGEVFVMLGVGIQDQVLDSVPRVNRELGVGVPAKDAPKRPHEDQVFVSGVAAPGLLDVVNERFSRFGRHVTELRLVGMIRLHPFREDLVLGFISGESALSAVGPLLAGDIEGPAVSDLDCPAVGFGGAFFGVLLGLGFDGLFDALSDALKLELCFLQLPFLGEDVGVAEKLGEFRPGFFKCCRRQGL